MNQLRLGAVLSGALLAACTNGGASEPEPLLAAGATVGPSEPEPFTWRRAGGETTDFGGNDQPVCADIASPITRQGAIDHGFDVDAELSKIEGVHQADLVWSEERCQAAGTCPHTLISITSRLESLTLHSRSLLPNVSAPADECLDDLQYVQSISLSTADGSITGTFQGNSFSRPNVGGGWSAGGFAALGDFRGSRPLALDAARPHWVVLQVGLALGGPELTGAVQATVYYTDGKSPDEQLALYGNWSNPGSAVPYGDPVPSGPDSIALDDYQGSTLPPTFEVEAKPEFDQPGARLRVSINGEVRSFDNLPEGQWLTLGRRRIGDVVSAEVTNDQGGSVESILRVAQCTWAYESCSTPGCTARAEVTVAPTHCDPGVYD